MVDILFGSRASGQPGAIPGEGLQPKGFALAGSGLNF